MTDDGTVAVQHCDFRADSSNTTPPLTTDTWLLRSTNGGAIWTEDRKQFLRHDHRAGRPRLLVGDYASLDFAGGGARPGFTRFQVRANCGDLANRTDVVAPTASTSGP